MRALRPAHLAPSHTRPISGREDVSEILSLNVSLPKEVRDGDRTLRTGIFKQPVTGQRMLRRTNLEGDGQADLENHGGSSKAACVYSHDHYAYWER